MLIILASVTLRFYNLYILFLSTHNKILQAQCQSTQLYANFVPQGCKAHLLLRSIIATPSPFIFLLPSTGCHPKNRYDFLHKSGPQRSINQGVLFLDLTTEEYK